VDTSNTTTDASVNPPWHYNTAYKARLDKANTELAVLKLIAEVLLEVRHDVFILRHELESPRYHSVPVTLNLPGLTDSRPGAVKNVIEGGSVSEANAPHETVAPHAEGIASEASVAYNVYDNMPKGFPYGKAESEK